MTILRKSNRVKIQTPSVTRTVTVAADFEYPKLPTATCWGRAGGQLIVADSLCQNAFIAAVNSGNTSFGSQSSAFYHDGYIYVATNRELARVPITGGVPESLFSLSSSTGGERLSIVKHPGGEIGAYAGNYLFQSGTEHIVVGRFDLPYANREVLQEPSQNFNQNEALITYDLDRQYYYAGFGKFQSTSILVRVAWDGSSIQTLATGLLSDAAAALRSVVYDPVRDRIYLLENHIVGYVNPDGTGETILCALTDELGVTGTVYRMNLHYGQDLLYISGAGTIAQGGGGIWAISPDTGRLVLTLREPDGVTIGQVNFLDSPEAAGTGDFRFFRLRIFETQSTNQNFTGTRELELYTTVGGANVLPGKTKTMTASEAASGFGASGAFDESYAGGSGQGWAVSWDEDDDNEESGGHWVQVEVAEGEGFTPVQYGVGGYASGTSTEARSAKHFQLQASVNGVLWTTLDEQTATDWTGHDMSTPKKFTL